MNEKNSDSRVFSKKIFSIQERLKYCIDWKQSGMSKRIFCKNAGISSSALYNWCKQFKKELINDTAFSPVTLKALPVINRKDPIQLEIRLPNQAQLLITMPEQGLVSFIQELCHAASIIR